MFTRRCRVPALLWGIPLSLSFAAHTVEAAGSAPLAHAEKQATPEVKPGFDLGTIIEKVTHYVDEDPTQPNRFRSSDRTYEATLEQGVLLIQGIDPDQKGYGLEAGLEDDLRDAAPLGLELLSAFEGSRDLLEDGPLETRRHENTATLARGTRLEERYEMWRGAVDQTVSIDLRGRAARDIRLVFELSEGMLEEELEDGLLLSTPDGQHFLYERPSFRDGTGVMTEAQTRVTEGGGRVYLEIDVPAALSVGMQGRLELHSSIHALGGHRPGEGAEDKVAELAISTAAYAQRAPAIASNGEFWLVTWYDYRAGGTYPDIYGARVSSAGALIDPVGIAISTGSLTQSWPAVASDGNDFMVVWVDTRSGNPDIYGTRVGASGFVHSSSGKIISNETHTQNNPSIVWTGSSYLVVWDDDRGGDFDIYGARINNGGDVQGAEFAICDSEGTQRWPDLAKADDSTVLVAWHDIRTGSSYYNVYAARVNGSNGTVLDPNGFAVNANMSAELTPAVAWSGSSYLVLWHDNRTSGTTAWDIYGRRIGADGALLGAGAFVVNAAAGNQYYADVAWTGTGYLVVWEDQRNGTSDIYGTTLEADGTVLDTTGEAFCTATNVQAYPSVSSALSSTLVAWNDLRSGTYDIYARHYLPDATVLDPSPFQISSTGVEQNSPDVAWGGSSFLVVWGMDAAPSDLAGARVDSDGVLLDAAGFTLSSAANAQFDPAVIGNGNGWLTSWSDLRSGTSKIYAARVTSAGVVQDANGIAIASAASTQQTSDLAFDGTNHLVTWNDTRNGNPDIYAARVSTAGSVMDVNGIAVCTNTTHQIDPTVAFGSSDYLIAWRDDRNSARTNSDIYGGRVSVTGTSINGSGGFLISDKSTYQDRPRIAWGGLNYLLTWQDSANPALEIVAARVTASGISLDGDGFNITATGGTYSVERPDVAGNGSDFLVVWQDGSISGNNGDVFGCRITSGGVKVDGTGFPIMAGTPSQAVPRVAFGDGLYLVSYRGYYNNYYRAMGVRVSP